MLFIYVSLRGVDLRLFAVLISYYGFPEKVLLIKAECNVAVLDNELTAKELAVFGNEARKLYGAAGSEKALYLGYRYSLFTDLKSHTELAPLLVAHTAVA